MIEIDNDILFRINEYLNGKYDNNYKLFDLHDILECRKLYNELISDVNSKIKSIGEEFSKKYLDYLTGQKESDLLFAKGLKDYYIDTTLCEESRSVSDLLNQIISANTYFPIDRTIKERAKEYLNNHKRVSRYVDVNDKKIFESIFKDLSDAIFNPCRLLDSKFDETLRALKENYLVASLYMYRNIRHYIGSDYEGERLLEEMINLKDIFDSND